MKQVMYQVTFFILDEDNNEVVRSFSDTNLTNVLVYLGDFSWSLKRAGIPFRLVVNRIVDDTTTIVFSLDHTSL